MEPKMTMEEMDNWEGWGEYEENAKCYIHMPAKYKPQRASTTRIFICPTMKDFHKLCAE